MADRYRDDADLKRYRTEIPNMVYDIGMTPYEVALYGHFKRVCGAQEDGECWKSVATLAKETRMSAGRVSEARKELARRGLIRIEYTRPGGSVTVTIVDIWPQNMARYAPAATLQDMKAPSQYEGHPSRNPSRHETKKEPKKKPKEELGGKEKDDGWGWFAG